MGKLTFLSLCLGAVIVLSGCATTDYHQARYGRDTFQRIEEDARKTREPIPREPLSAGVARVEITPPVGMPLQGFGARMGAPSQGVHDPLYARVLVLRTGRSRSVLVSCDLMAVTDNLYEAVFQKVRRKMPFRRSEFILFATHTHSAAGGLTDRFALQFVSGRFRPKLFAETTDKIASAIVEAASDARPAQVLFESGEVAGLNQNRAGRNGSVDREIKVMRLAIPDGKPIAWLVNFAAHPTVFGANWEFSADFPGYLAGSLERDGAVCLFANGAAGDLNIQGHHGESREARAARAGGRLAEKAIELTAGAKNEDGLAMDCRRVEIELPPVQIRVGSNPRMTLPGLLGDRLFPRRAPLHLVRLNRELLLAVPAELSAEIGIAFKQAAKKLGYDLFVIGYADDYIGYVVSERLYETGAYEARTSFYGPKFDSYLTEVVLKMMETMKGNEAVE